MLPRKAPIPFDISISSPWALARILDGTCRSMYNDPETLKKSKAIPYIIQDATIIHNPSAGLPNPNKPNLNTQANMLIIITFFIPKRVMKNGIAKIKHTSDICEIDRIIAGCLTLRMLINAKITDTLG